MNKSKLKRLLIFFIGLFLVWLVASIIFKISLNKKFDKLNFSLLKYELKESHPCHLEINDTTHHLKDNFYLVRYNGYFYIVKLSKIEALNIQSFDFNNNKTYTIKGYSKTIDEELRNCAIAEINDMLNEEKITDYNFKNYIGNIYLDQTQHTNIIYLLIGISVLLFTISLILILLNKKENRVTK